MKASVQAFLMLMMVLSFVINAFASKNVSPQTINDRLKAFVPVGHNGGVYNGTTAGGKDCEFGIGADQKGVVSISITYGTWMGMGYHSFEVENRTILDYREAEQSILITSINHRNGLNTNEQLVIEKSFDQQGNSTVKSVEFLEEQEGWFGGKSMKSVVKCG